YAAERHANDCSFCSEAIDGLSVHSEDAVNHLEALTPEFIYDHFQRNLPPVHLNSIASARITESVPAKDKKSGINRLHISALASTLLLSFFLIRGWKPQRPPDRQVTLSAAIADTTPVAAANPAKEKSRKKTGAPPSVE